MSSSSRWAMVVGFPAAGFALLWSASEQLDEVRRIVATTFEWPAWRLLAWLVTVMAVGAAFSLAATAARTAGTERSRPDGLATWVVVALPLATVLSWWVHLSFISLPALDETWWPWSPLDIFPIATSCVIVGFLLTGLIASRVRLSK